MKKGFRREKSEQKADGGRTRVAHEDLGAARVIGQKAEARAAEHEGGDGSLLVAKGECDQGKGKRFCQRDTRAETVKSVDEIVGVDKGEDPRECQRKGKKAELCREFAKREAFDHVTAKHGDACGGALGEKL